MFKSKQFVYQDDMSNKPNTVTSNWDKIIQDDTMINTTWWHQSKPLSSLSLHFHCPPPSLVAQTQTPEPIIDKVNKSDGATVRCLGCSALAPAYNELCLLVSIRIKLFSVLRIVLSCFGKKINSFEYLHKRKIGSNLSLSNCQRVHWKPLNISLAFN